VLVLRAGLAGPERGHNFDTPRLISNFGYGFDRGGGGGGGIFAAVTIFS